MLQMYRELEPGLGIVWGAVLFVLGRFGLLLLLLLMYAFYSSVGLF